MPIYEHPARLRATALECCVSRGLLSRHLRNPSSQSITILHKEDPIARERILVVEDEITTAMELCGSLRQPGYEPLGPCASEQEAFTNALTLHPDAILMISA